MFMGKFDKNITDEMDSSWEFNEEVTKCFENMLERSIPSYETMRHLVDIILINHIKSHQLMHTNILDLGSSEGKSINEASQHLKTNYFLGLECSEPMLKSARKHYRNNINVDFMNIDLREVDELPVKQCGGILSILTLQFIPIEYRQKIVRMVYESLHSHGVFIFVEKVLGDSYQTSQIYEDLYYDTKMVNGYSLDEIRDKKLKLEGVLVPVTNSYNISLLKQAGFKNIDIFWKHLNFVGYIAYKK